MNTPVHELTSQVLNVNEGGSRTKQIKKNKIHIEDKKVRAQNAVTALLQNPTYKKPRVTRKQVTPFASRNFVSSRESPDASASKACSRIGPKPKKYESVVYMMTMFKDGKQLTSNDIDELDEQLKDDLHDDIETKILFMTDDMDKNEIWIDLDKQAVMSFVTGSYFPKFIYKFHDEIGDRKRFEVDPYSFYKEYSKEEYETKMKQNDKHRYEVEINWNYDD